MESHCERQGCREHVDNGFSFGIDTLFDDDDTDCIKHKEISKLLSITARHCNGGGGDICEQAVVRIVLINVGWLFYLWIGV